MRRALAIGAGAVCLAAVAVAIAALSEAGSASGSPISAPGHWGSALDVALAVAFAAYVVGLVLLSRTTVPAWPVLALVAAIQLTPLAGPIALSGFVLSDVVSTFVNA